MRKKRIYSIVGICFMLIFLNGCSQDKNRNENYNIPIVSLEEFKNSFELIKKEKQTQVTFRNFKEYKLDGQNVYEYSFSQDDDEKQIYSFQLNKKLNYITKGNKFTLKEEKYDLQLKNNDLKSFLYYKEPYYNKSYYKSIKIPYLDIEKTYSSEEKIKDNFNSDVSRYTTRYQKYLDEK